jgi:rhamnosyltransferase
MVETAPTAAESTRRETHIAMDVVAVLTAYHPDERLQAVVESALRTCSSVIVVDNTPDVSASLAPSLAGPRVTVLANGRNVGLGGALNLAVASLPAGAEAVLFMDQDSVLPGDVVTGLAADLADPTIGIAAPSPWDPKHEAYYCSTANRTETISDEEAVITSGMMVRRSVLDQVPFREDLFIDWVDVAFCLDARRTGARVVIDWRLRLPHSIGDCAEHRRGWRTVHYSHYPAWRLYWIGRNVSVIHRGHFDSRARALASSAVFMADRLLNTVLFEPKRRTHVPALVRGFRDGFSERVDPRYLPAGAEYPKQV